MRVWCAPSVGFRGSSFEIRGRRGEAGQTLVGVESIPSPEIEVTYEHSGLAWQQVLRRALRFTTNIANNVAQVGISPIYSTFFGQISEMLSIAESIEVLLADRRPVESAALLPALNLCAARFEIYEREPDLVVGTAARWIADSFSRLSSLYSDQKDLTPSKTFDKRGRDILQQVVHLGFEIPERSPEIATTEIYLEHGDTIGYIEEIEQWGELAINLHSEMTQGRLEFHTRATSDDLIRATAGTTARALTYSTVIFAEIMAQPVELDEAAEIDTLGQKLESDES